MSRKLRHNSVSKRKEKGTESEGGLSCEDIHSTERRGITRGTEEKKGNSRCHQQQIAHVPASIHMHKKCSKLSTQSELLVHTGTVVQQVEEGSKGIMAALFGKWEELAKQGVRGHFPPLLMLLSWHTRPLTLVLACSHCALTILQKYSHPFTNT